MVIFVADFQSMKNTARIQKRLILLIAFSIIWIFIGSLVIFHQEQVMGKAFKWNISFVVPKSKDERSNSKSKAELSTDHHQHVILAVVDDSRREKLLSGIFSIQTGYGRDIVVPLNLNQSTSFRAPPTI